MGKLMVINVDISTVTPPGRGRSETSDGLGGNGLEGDQPKNRHLSRPAGHGTSLTE